MGLLITSVKSPVGIICLIIVPCAIIMVFEIIKIIGMFAEKKNRQRAEEEKKKEDELEQLRQRIHELEQSSSVAQPSQESEEKI